MHTTLPVTRILALDSTTKTYAGCIGPLLINHINLRTEDETGRHRDRHTDGKTPDHSFTLSAMDGAMPATEIMLLLHAYRYQKRHTVLVVLD